MVENLAQSRDIMQSKSPLDVGAWIEVHAGRGSPSNSDGSFLTMMGRVAEFHAKHDFASNNGHDMGYRLALTLEELGEFSAAITKGRPIEEVKDELADVLILILGHALALEIDLESSFHDKITRILQRPSKIGRLGVRVTETG